MTLNDPIYTIRQLAEYLQISRSKLYYLASRKQLPIIRVGRNIRVRESDILKWLERRLEKTD